MEAVGLGAGIIGLAGLFTACVDCFELVQRGRYLGKEYFLLETKFANQRLRLITWGRACGFTDPAGYDARLDEEDTRNCVHATLLHLLVLFNDGKALRKRYGLRLDPPVLAMDSPASALLESALHWQRSWTDNLTLKLSELKDRTRSTQKQAGFARTTRWAIEDKRKFTELVQHLKDLIDDLQGFTGQLGIKDRQKEMIRWEVESISDIATLETMEEARAGNADLVSDAATLRLWNLRDKFVSPAPEDHNVPKQSQQISHVQADNEWEEVGEEADHSTSARYQILHRVACDQEKPALYLDPPSYQHSAQDEWVVLEPGHSKSESASVHLTGKRRLLDFGAYMAHNDQLLFICIKDYKCNHNVVRFTPCNVDINGQQVHVASAEVISALNKLVRTEAGFHWWPRLQSVLVAHNPFSEWFHLQDALKKSSKLQQCADQMKAQDPNGFGVFFDFMGGLLEGTHVAIEEMTSRHNICWRYLIYIYAVGAIIVKRDSRGPEYSEAYEQTGMPYYKDGGKPTLSIEIPAMRWAYDGNFQRIYSTLSIPWSNFKTPDKEVPLASLLVVPLCHAREISASDLQKRGETFWKCRNARYVSYTGHLVGGRFTEGRYVVDNARYGDHPNSERFLGFKQKLRDELGEATIKSDALPSGSFSLLLPYFLVGFNMADHVWNMLLVSCISDMKWESEAFDQLIMNPKSKELLRVLVVAPQKSPALGKKANLRTASQSMKRQVILFHGGPGTGKSMAAEAVAHLAQKPLCRLKMSTGEAKATEPQKFDRIMLRMLESWDSVFLIDDADHILQATSKPTQSSMVSAFLRFVDSFQGILIISTSRAGNFDEAFVSRITLAVHFPLPTQADRRIIWERSLKKSLSDEEWNGICGELDLLSERCRNGREIHNVISTARTVAEFDQRSITVQLLIDISESTRSLERYRNSIHGGIAATDSNNDSANILHAASE